MPSARKMQICLSAAAVILLLLPVPSFPVGFKVLHSFSRHQGIDPHAVLTADPAGGFYGTTLAGGSADSGTVFHIAPDGKTTILHDFAGAPNDGAGPEGSAMILDANGSLYGTTAGGGASGNGTAFKLASDGTETVLYSFGSNGDGAWPLGIVADKTGNSYGATFLGGAASDGTVFRLAPDGTETVLHSFSGGDGSLPETGLLLDKKGNLYGTTSRDGASGGGTVFRISPGGTFVTLYSFSGYGDGGGPESDLIADGDGNLYGTTAAGGIHSGVVFKLAKDGTETVLYDFGGAPDGWLPLGNLVLDAQGNLYGATLFGGDETPNGCHRAGCGVVWRLTPNGKETVLHAFENRSDGRYPYAGVVLDANGNLWGTAADGGTYRSGTVFRVKP